MIDFNSLIGILIAVGTTSGGRARGFGRGLDLAHLLGLWVHKDVFVTAKYRRKDVDEPEINTLPYSL